MVSVADPVAAGLVASLARPGGNVTGLSRETRELIGKTLQLLKEALPETARVDLLVNPTDPLSSTEVADAKAAAKSIGAQLKIVGARAPTELEGAFSTIRADRADALLVVGGAGFYLNRTQIASLALRNRLPSAFQAREFVDVGGLLSYAPSTVANYRRAAFFVDKILKGAKPADLPVEQRSLIENGFNIGERQHLTAADRVWLAAPLFWSFGSANALPAIVTHGGSIVLQESFEPGEALALLDEQRCSVYYGMPTMAHAMLEHPDRRRRALAAMRTGLTIGLPEDIRMTMEAVAARELCNVYGSTETYGNCAVTDAHDELALRLETQGRPLPGMATRVVDPQSGQTLRPGEVGEFRATAPSGRHRSAPGSAGRGRPRRPASRRPS